MDLDPIWLVSLTEPTQEDHHMNVKADWGDVLQATEHQTLAANRRSQERRVKHMFPWEGTCSWDTLNCETIEFCSLSHSVCGICYRSPRKLIQGESWSRSAACAQRRQQGFSFDETDTYKQALGYSHTVSCETRKLSDLNTGRLSSTHIQYHPILLRKR